MRTVLPVERPGRADLWITLSLASLAGAVIGLLGPSGLALLIFGGLAWVGCLNLPVMAASSLFLLVALPEGELMPALGFYLPMASLHLHLIDGLFAANLSAFVALWLQGRVRIPPKPLNAWIILLLLLSVASFLYGTPRFGAKAAYLDLRGMLYYLSYFLALGLVTDDGRARWMIRVLFAGLMGHAILVGLLHTFSSVLISPERYYDLFNYENTVGRFSFSNSDLIPMMLPFALVFGKRELVGWFPKPLWPAALLLLLPLLISMSRASLALLVVNTLACSLVATPPSRQQLLHWAKPLGGSVIALGILGAIAPHIPALAAIAGRLDALYLAQSFAGRALSSLHAYQAFGAHPLTGLGLGSTLGLVWITGEIQDTMFVDDAWATVLAKTGIWGGLLLLGLLVQAGRSLLSAGHRADGRDHRVARAAFACLPFTLVPLTVFSSYVLHSRVMIVACCALLALLPSQDPERSHG